MGGRGRCNSTSAMLLRVLEPRSPVPHFNQIRPPFRRRSFFDRSWGGYNEFEIEQRREGILFFQENLCIDLAFYRKVFQEEEDLEK